MLIAVAALLIASPAPSGIPEGHANFNGISDQQVVGWLSNARFFHAANVFRCQGLRRLDAERELGEALGPGFETRQAAIRRELARRYGPDDDTIVLPIGYRTTRAYCRSIRYVVVDLLRGTAELERRLGIRG